MTTSKTKKGIPRLWKEEPRLYNTSENIKMLAQGAEAKVYEVYYEESEKDEIISTKTAEVSDDHLANSVDYVPIPSVFIVKERLKKTYRHPILDAKLIKERMRQEARLMHRCQSYGISTPLVYMINDAQGKIYMERIDGLTAKEYFKRCYDESSQKYDEKAFRVAELIGKSIASFHDHEIVHGDPTTSNFMVRSKEFQKQQSVVVDGIKEGITTNSQEEEIVVIDFGLGSSNASEEDKAVDLYVLERAIISTHHNSETLVSTIMDVYSKSSQPKKCTAVYKRLEDVKRRGRKRDMTG